MEMRISEAELCISTDEHRMGLSSRRLQLGWISGGTPELGRISGRLSAPSAKALGARPMARSGL